MPTTPPNNNTGLYGSSASSPSIPTNNTSGLYGIDNGAVYINNDVVADQISANSIVANTITTTGNITVGGTLIGNVQGDVTGNVLGDVTGNVTGNFQGGNILADYGVINNDLTVGGTIYGTFAGNVSGNLVVPGSNTQILFNNSGNAGANSNFTFNKDTATMTLNGLANVTGNVQAAYFLGNGSQLTGLPAQYGNANVAAYLPTYTGNLSAGNISITGVYAGNAAGLTAIPGANVTGTVPTATLATYVTANAQANITSLGTLTSLSVSGNSLLGNINVATNKIIDVGNNYVSNVAYPLAGTDAATKAYVDQQAAGDLFAISDGIATEGVAKGDTLTFEGVVNETTVVVSSPSNVTIGLPDDVTIQGNITANGNVSGNYILGNGSLLTGVTSSLSGNLAGNIQGNGFGIANVSFLTSTGNITGNYFIGDGSQLTNLPPGNYSNANVAAYLPTYTGNLSAGNITATGNITGAYIIGNGALLTSITGANVTGTVANATYADTAGLASYVTGNAQGNITSVGTLTSLSVTGNTTSGNIISNGLVTATGNITGANVIGTYLWGDGSNITGVVAGSQSVQISVKNTSGGTLSKGTPVYPTGTVGAGTTLEVAAARADTPATMPAIGLLESTLTNNATGYAISVGSLQNINTSSYSIGTILYVAAAGGFTNVRPNDGYLVQPIGTVGRVNAVTGTLDVNIWNYLQLPNLGSGNIWLGNANSVPTETTLSSYTGNIGAGNLSVSGNIAAGNITVTGVYYGNGSGLSSLTGANVTGTVANATYATSAGTAVTVTGNAQPNITSVGTLSSVTVTGNISGGNISTGGQITVTGNITSSGNISGSYLLGNGSQLTGISASLSNVTGNITFTGATGLTPKYITITTDAPPGTGLSGIRIGTGAQYANLSTYGNGAIAIGRYAGYDSQGVDSIAIGGVAGYQYQGPGAVAIGQTAGRNSQGQETVAIGDSAGYESQGEVAIAIGSSAGRNNQGNRSIAIGQGAGNSNQGNTSIAMGFYAGAANQPANSIILNANGMTSLDATNSGLYIMPVRNDSGNTTNAIFYNTTTKELTYSATGGSTYGNANVANFLANYGSNTLVTTGNITAGNVSITGIASVTGNITGGNLTTSGLLSAVTINATGNITGGNIDTAGIFTASNITANLQIANLIINNQQIQTTQQRNTSVISATVVDPARIVIGTGFNGNLGAGNDISGVGRGARLLVSDAVSMGDIQQRVNGFAVQQYYTATANITNTNTRAVGGTMLIGVGGGTAGNTWQSTSPFGVIGFQAGVVSGPNISGSNLSALGSTTVLYAAGMSGTVATSAGGNIKTAFGSLGSLTASGVAGNIGNGIGFTTQFGSGTGTTWLGNVYAFYHPGSTSNYGLTTANAARQTTNYYFLRNEDNVAQNMMGSMRLWHNFRYDITPTTGAITIDKNNGQTQYLAVTGNITGITLSNFVTTASDGTNTDQEMDTVTLWVRQDATGRTITMPTGANYFYTGGTTTVPTTANSVSKIEFTAIDNGGTTQYLIDISAAYTST